MATHNSTFCSRNETTCCGKINRISLARYAGLIGIATGLVSLIFAVFILGFRDQMHNYINQKASINQEEFKNRKVSEEKYHENIRKFTFQRVILAASWIIGFTYALFTIPKGLLLLSSLKQTKRICMMFTWLVFDMVANIICVLTVCGAFIICGIMVFYNYINVGLAFVLLLFSILFLVILFYSWSNVYRLYKLIKIEQEVIINPDELQ